MTDQHATPTREELVKLCEDGIVPHDRWHDRDSSSAQRQLGEALVLLRAGCEFSVRRDDWLRTWWVTIEFRGFSSFEYGDDAPLSDETFYIPVRERLDQCDGQDWY